MGKDNLVKQKPANGFSYPTGLFFGKKIWVSTSTGKF